MIAALPDYVSAPGGPGGGSVSFQKCVFQCATRARVLSILFFFVVFLFKKKKKSLKYSPFLALA